MQFISDLQYDFYWFISTFLVLCPTSTTITGNLRVKPLVEGIAAEWHRSPLHVYQLQPTSWTSLALCSPLCLDTQRECLLSQWRMADRSNRRRHLHSYWQASLHLRTAVGIRLESRRERLTPHYLNTHESATQHTWGRSWSPLQWSCPAITVIETAPILSWSKWDSFCHM